MSQKSDSPTRAVGLLSSAVPFLRIHLSSSPPVGEVVTCMRKCAGLRGRAWLATVLFCQSNQSWSWESARWNIQPVTVRQALGGRSVVFLFILLFYQAFIPGKSTEHGCSSSAVPSFPFIRTKHSRLLLLAEQLHWSAEGAIIKGFPCLMCRVLWGCWSIYLTQQLPHHVWRLSEIIFLTFSLKLDFQGAPYTLEKGAATNN